MQSIWGSRTLWWVLSVSAVVAGIPAHFAGVAVAGTIDIVSQAGKGSNSKGVPNVAIVVTPAWAIPTNPAYEWISYAQTGCETFDPATGRCTANSNEPPGTPVTGNPTATFYQTFTLTSESSGDLEVWADDTAGVWLDNGAVTSGTGRVGTVLWAPNGNLGPNCANAPIGCTGSNGAIIPLNNLQAGTYTLVFDAYQLVGGTPFGLMYTGDLTSNATTPEPASYMLMGFGLAVLGTLFRRRK